MLSDMFLKQAGGFDVTTDGTKNCGTVAVYRKASYDLLHFSET